MRRTHPVLTLLLTLSTSVACGSGGGNAGSGSKAKVEDVGEIDTIEYPDDELTKDIPF